MIIESGLCPSAALQPRLVGSKVAEAGLCGITTTGAHTMQIDVDIREQVVAGFCAPYSIDTSLMVVSHLMAGSPESTATRFRQCLITHDGGQGTVLVISSVGGGVHVAVVDRETVPDVIEFTCYLLLEAHQVLLVLQHGIPNT